MEAETKAAIDGHRSELEKGTLRHELEARFSIIVTYDRGQEQFRPTCAVPGYLQNYPFEPEDYATMLEAEAAIHDHIAGLHKRAR